MKQIQLSKSRRESIIDSAYQTVIDQTLFKLKYHSNRYIFSSIIVGGGRVELLIWYLSNILPQNLKKLK